MRFTLLVIVLLMLVVPVKAQEDTLYNDADPVSAATPASRAVLVDMSNPDDVALALKKIHTFRYLETLVLEGEADEKDVRKLFYRVASLKNLQSLELRDVEIKEVPENIAGIKMLRSLTIDGNTEMNYQKLFQDLRPAKISELTLIDNDLKRIPAEISEIKSLRKVRLSGSLQMDYSDFVDRLSVLPALNTLCIPLNYITELPKNIEKLTGLQVLDVSNNNLTGLPAEMSTLRTINNLSIYGNLLLDPAKDLEKLKGNTIKYLALDKEISGEELEQIKKIFPFAIIDFPLNKESIPEKKPETAEPVYSGEVKVKKEIRILSGAYLSYPSLFQGMMYNFDTLTFEQRFNDLRYNNVFQSVTSRGWKPGQFFLSHRPLAMEGRDKKEICFYFPRTDQQFIKNYPEILAYSGMYWVYKGPLTRKQFRKNFIFEKQKNFFSFRARQYVPWNDLRIDIDKNNSQLLVTLKGDTGYSQFKAYPMSKNIPRENVIETYNRRYLQYKKTLQRRADRFNRQLIRNRARYEAAYKTTEDFAWKILQRLMSNEEKLMSRKQWLDYYDAVIANEMAALDRSKPSMPFIIRAFSVRGYNIDAMVANTPTASFTDGREYGSRRVNVDFVDKDGAGRLAVKTILLVDNKQKTVLQTTGTLGLAPVSLNIHQFVSHTIMVELRNGNIGVVESSEIDGFNLDRDKTYTFRTIVYDRNLNTLGDMLGTALK